MIEDVGLKQRIFADLERVCRPDAILSSNTSTIDISLIGAKTRAAERIVGAHFFSPAHIMPLLEIVRTDKTSPQARLRPLTGLVQADCILSSYSACLPLEGFGDIQRPQIRGTSHQFRQSLQQGARKALQLQGSFRVLNSSGCKGSACASHFSLQQIVHCVGHASIQGNRCLLTASSQRTICCYEGHVSWHWDNVSVFRVKILEACDDHHCLRG